jgi:hypothetical protein
MKITKEMIESTIRFHEKAEKAYRAYGQPQKAEKAAKKKAELMQRLNDKEGV